MAYRSFKWFILGFLGLGLGILIGFEFNRNKVQAYTLPNTEVRHLDSQAVGIKYKLYISLPNDYSTSDKAYPVVYLLDADYSFAIARNIVEHLSDRKNLPKFILVGIAYENPANYKLNRTRDYTPIFVADGGYGAEYQKVSGGAPRFRQFLQTELLPYMQSHYRVQATSILAGHSFGGLFATWVALTTPSLFSGYISISPSLWYGEHYIFKVLDRYSASVQQEPAKLFLAIGSEENGGDYKMVDDLQKFAQQLEKSKPSPEQLTLKILAGDNHNTLFPGAFTQGLLYLQGQKL